MKYGLGSVTGRDTKLGGNWFPCTRFHCIGREIGVEVNSRCVEEKQYRKVRDSRK